MKKLKIFALSGVLALLMGTTAFAEGEKKVDITKPDGYTNDTYETEIIAENIEVKSCTVRLGDGGQSKDVTSDMKYKIKENGTLYVEITDKEDNTYEESFEIDFIDKNAPELIGAIDEGILTLNVADDLSGIKSLIVNGYEYENCPDGELQIRLQQFDASYEKFSIFVTDNAGNYSEEYIIENPYFSPESDGKDEKEDKSIFLPINAEGSPITSASGTVTYHATEYGYNYGPGEVLDVSGNKVEAYDGMEFFIIKTKSDKTFYMVIDKSKEDNNAYLLTEADEADLLNYTGTDKEVLPKNGAVIAGTYEGKKDKKEKEEETVTKGGTYNAAPDAIGNSEEVKVEPKKKKPNNSNTVMIIIIAAAFAGVAIFMKKKKKTKTEAPIEDTNNTDDDFEEEEED